MPGPIRAIKTVTVSWQAYGKIREFSGVVEAADRSSIGFEVSGNVSEVRVDVGDRISKGQVLAVLDQHTFHINVKAAEAELGRAKVEMLSQWGRSMGSGHNKILIIQYLYPKNRHFQDLYPPF